MTLPNERVLAVCNAYRFIHEIASGEIKRIPGDVRQRARALLRHFPNAYHLDLLANGNPEYFSTKKPKNKQEST